MTLRYESGEPDATVFAFYYLWYGNPSTDGRWLHWNHSVLPHWTPAVHTIPNHSRCSNNLRVFCSCCDEQNRWTKAAKPAASRPAW